MNVCHTDFETHSTVDLNKAGVYVYAESPWTDVWCAAYAFGAGPVQIWQKGQPMPDDLREHVTSGGEFAAWNAAFERIIWRDVLGRRYGWPVPKLEQWRCVMVEAYAMSLPGKLERAAAALGLATQKDMEGHALMMRMSRPRRYEEDGTPVWWTDPARLERLYAYCRQDVETEREAEKRLLRLSPAERELWLFDQRINDRGVYVDRQSCDAAKRVVDGALKDADKQMRALTHGAVGRCSEAAKLIAWLRGRGVATDSVDKAAMAELMAQEWPEDVRAVLALRASAAKSSTAKIAAMLGRCCADGRMRGNLQFHGAGTGRWAGRGAQLQNLPRPSKANEDLTEAIFGAVNTCDWRTVEALFGSPLQAVSDIIRGMIAAPPGRVIMAADFSNIEGRGVAWLAGEETKLERFRAFDRGDGPDIYLVAAAAIYNVPVKEAKPFRQIGKVAELALGYNGGPSAFAAMAKGYGLKIETALDAVWTSATQENRDAALEAWDERGKASGMQREAWIASELIKRAWRQAHPETVDLWRGLEDAAVRAVMSPGSVQRYKYIAFRMVGSFLFCRLPSGRSIAYPSPRVTMKPTPWGTERPSLSYMSINQFSRKWERKHYYGGLGSENVTQAVARDVMAEAMLRVEAAGYPVTLTVHDEVVAEPEAGFGSLDEFNELMQVLPTWAAGLPLAAAGWVGPRYRK